MRFFATETDLIFRNAIFVFCSVLIHMTRNVHKRKALCLTAVKIECWIEETQSVSYC